MDQLINTIRAAIMGGASTEQKMAGVQACRTIISALDTEPGKPLMPPMSPAATTRPTLDQMLDLVIARLTSIANSQDTATALPSATNKVASTATRLPASPPRGLRVPSAMAAPRSNARAVNARAQTKLANTPVRKP